MIAKSTGSMSRAYKEVDYFRSKCVSHIFDKTEFKNKIGELLEKSPK